MKSRSSVIKYVLIIIAVFAVIGILRRVYLNALVTADESLLKVVKPGKYVGMQECSVAIWNYLDKQHASTIFGLPGGPIASLFSTMPKSFTWIDLGNELQNGFSAGAYGQYSNTVGILMVTNGPGIATALSSLQNAINEQFPLLIVTPYAKSGEVGEFQQWNILEIAKKVTPNVFYIDKCDDVISTLSRAYELAKNKATGVVLLVDPTLFMQKCRLTEPESRIDVHDEQSKIFQTLSDFNNQKLLVVLGKCKSDEYDAIKRFIIRNQLPYVTAWTGRIEIDNGFFCGRIGTLGNHSANYAAYHATRILIIGNVSGQLHSSTKNKFSVILTANAAKVCTFACNANENIMNSDVFIMSSFKETLDQLNFESNIDWQKQLTTANQKLYYELPAETTLEKYSLSAAKVYAHHKLEIPVTTGVGNHWYSIGKYMNITAPNCWESSTTWGSIGCGMAYGIGIYHATKKPVWVFEGDGGFVFSAGNLAYLLNNKHIPITVTVYVNHIYAAVQSYYDMYGLENPTNVTNRVSNIEPFIKMLDNVYVFDTVAQYHDYLMQYPISKTLRFIIINIQDTNQANNVYEINANKHYQDLLRNNKFAEITQHGFTLRSDTN